MKKLLASLLTVLIALGWIPLYPVHASQEPETTWLMDRPTKYIAFNSSSYNVDPPERVENAETNDEASIGIGVEILTITMA